MSDERLHELLDSYAVPRCGDLAHRIIELGQLARRVAAGAGDPQVHSADCNVTMGRRSADHRIHCDCTVAAGDRPPAPSAVLLAALEAHRRYHRTLCGGDDDCYVCQAEDTLRAVRPPPRAALTVERLAALLREMGETVLADDYSLRGEWDKLAAWLLPRLAAPTLHAAALETLLAWVQSELHREPDDESFRSPVWYCGYCDTSGPARETIAHVALCPVAAALAVLTMAGAASPAAAPREEGT